MVELDFEDHANVLVLIKQAQDPEQNNRSKVEEQKKFIYQASKLKGEKIVKIIRMWTHYQ